ncbi:MAG: EAL domain-containing protein [Alphaproteobacteria bacterium]
MSDAQVTAFSAGATEDDRSDWTDLVNVLAASGDLLFEWDLAADRIAWTGDIALVAGIASPTRVPSGDTYLRHIHPEDLPHRMVALNRHLEKSEPFDCEYRIRGDDGSFRWIRERAIVRVSPSGKPRTLTGVIRDISQRKNSEEQIAYLTNHDVLTGQYNRARLREALEHMLDANLRRGMQGGFLLIAVDKLNILAEVFGEDTADNIVVNVARRIENCLRAGDVVGRVGADRFAVVLHNCHDNQVASVADRFLAAIRDLPIATPTGTMHVTASAGATVFPSSARSAGEIVAQADNALRSARRLGCDCYLDYRDIPAHNLTGRPDLVIAEQVKRALREDRFILAYQPIVDAATGEVAFYEGLARMKDEKGELVPAGSFVPVIEQMGLMRLIDRRVLDLGLTALEANPDIRLSINVSGLTAIDPIWLGQLSSRLENRRDVAERLTLEITETVALDDIDESSRFVRTLGNLGCRVALDDFGAGFTSFRHLRALNVDIVKIDGSFVRELACHPDNLLFVRTLIRLAHGIGLKTVAEWVETDEEANLLREEGVDCLQGWFCGKPTIEPEWDRSREQRSA